MASVVGELLVQVGSGFDSKGFDKAKQGASGLTKAFQSMGGAVQVAIGSIVANLAINLGRAIVRTAKQTIDLASAFEASFSKIENLVGVPTASIGKLEEAVLDLAPAVGVGPVALSDALFVLTSAGLSADKALDVVELAAKASAIGLGETKTVAQAVAAAITAYGEENLNAAQATEILVKTIRLGNLEAGSLAPVLGRVVGIAAEMGVSFEEVGASIATYTRLGVNAEEATTGLRGALNLILNPGNEMRKVLKTMELSADDLRNKLGKEGLQKTLEFLLTEVEGNKDALGDMIPNVRALALVLGTAGSQAKQYAEITREMTTTSDILGDSFEKTKETLKFQAAAFKAAGAAAMIAFGDLMLPAVKGATTVLTELTVTVKKNVDSVKETATAWDNFTDALDRLTQPLSDTRTGFIDTVDQGLAPLRTELKELIDRVFPGFDAAVEKSRGKTESYGESLAVFGVNAAALTDVLNALAGGINALSNEMGIGGGVVRDYEAEMRDWLDAVEDSIEAGDEAATETERLAEAQRKAAAAAKKLTEEERKAAKELKDLADQSALTARLVVELSNDFSGLKTGFDLTKPSIILTGDALDLFRQQTEEAVEAINILPPTLRTLGDEGQKAAQKIKTSFAGMVNNIVRDIGGWDDVKLAFDDLGQFAINFFSASGPWGQAIAAGIEILGVDLGTGIRAIRDLIKDIVTSGDKFELGPFGTDLPNTLDEFFNRLAGVAGRAMTQVMGFVESLERQGEAMAAIGLDFDTKAETLSFLEQAFVELFTKLGGFAENVPAVADALAFLSAWIERLRQEIEATSPVIEDFIDGMVGGGTTFEVTPSFDFAELLPVSEIIAGLFGTIDTEVARLRLTAETLGEPFDEAAVRAALLVDAIKAYINAGGRNAEVLDALSDALKGASAQFEEWVGLLEDVVDTLSFSEQVLQDLDEDIEAINRAWELHGDEARLLQESIRATNRAMEELITAVADGAISAADAAAAYEILDGKLIDFKNQLQALAEVEPPASGAEPEEPGVTLDDGATGKISLEDFNASIDVEVQFDRRTLDGLLVNLGYPQSWFLEEIRNATVGLAELAGIVLPEFPSVVFGTGGVSGVSGAGAIEVNVYIGNEQLVPFFVEFLEN